MDKFVAAQWRWLSLTATLPERREEKGRSREGGRGEEEERAGDKTRRGEEEGRRDEQEDGCT